MKKNSLIGAITIFLIFMTIMFSVIFALIKNGRSVWLTLAISFGTTAYHFVIRLLSASFVRFIFEKKLDCWNKWFLVTSNEIKLYKILKVKYWKNKLPTYIPESFDISKNSWEQIIKASCMAELIHEIIIALGFVPILFSFFLGALFVFLITSLLAGGIDLLFVLIQRYNRPRYIKMLSITKQKYP